MAITLQQVLRSLEQDQEHQESLSLDLVDRAEKEIDGKLSDLTWLERNIDRHGHDRSHFIFVGFGTKLNDREQRELERRYMAADWRSVETRWSDIVECMIIVLNEEHTNLRP